MSERWVVNASPLILLGKIQRLPWLIELSDELVIPEAVEREVSVASDARSQLSSLMEHPRVFHQRVMAVESEIAVWDLGRGESEVLQLAVHMGWGARVVVDDREARRCAQALGVRVIGTLGIVLKAKRKGLTPQARPVVEDLCRAGMYVSETLIERALRHLGE